MTQPNGFDPNQPDERYQGQPNQQYQPQYQQQYNGQQSYNGQYNAQYNNAPHPPQPDYMQLRRYQQHPNRWNGMAIAGFICSFFIAILGLIFSILGLVKINKTHEKGKGLAIAGIVISVVAMVFTFTTLSGSLDEFTSTYSSSPTASASASNSASSSDSSTTNDDILAQYTQQLEANLDTDAAHDAYTNVEQLVKTSQFQQQLKTVTDSLPDGISASVSAKSDTVTMVLTVDESYESQVKSALAKISGQQSHDDLQDLADSLDEICGDEGNTTVRLTIQTKDGTQLFDQFATADDD